jgi:hypothetical protein
LQGRRKQPRRTCIAQNELKQGLLLNCNFVNAVNALGIKDELGHKMKMFRQKSYDVLKGPPLQLLF